MRTKIQPVGWEPLPSAEWIDVVAFLESMTEPWPKPLAAHDLRWHATMERRGGEPFPSRRWFAVRWRWTEHAVRAMLASEDWRDPAHGRPARMENAQPSPSRRPAVAQDSPADATANAEESTVFAQPSPSRRPAVAQDSPHARSSSSPITDHRSPEDPSGGVAGATEPKPDPAADVYRAWRQTHPRAPERPSPDSRKACTRILAECGTLTAAVTYIAWVADAGDERAAQLRGQAPWPDGARLRRDDLESLSRHIPSRLPMALAWDERGRRPADRSAPARATSPPPSNRIAAAEADRQARTRRLLAESADPFAPASLIGDST